MVRLALLLLLLVVVVCGLAIYASYRGASLKEIFKGFLSTKERLKKDLKEAKDEVEDEFKEVEK